MKIAVKEIPANKKWQLGGFYFESQAITKGEGLKNNQLSYMYDVYWW
jgi:hypothetical protein